jgi:hypothetical protein
MPATYNILIMGASYGSLLASKLLFSGHQVKLVCLPAEADLINAEGFRVRMPVKGRKDPVEIDSRKLPGKVSAAGPGDVNPADYDLVGLAMQEPQYRSPGVRQLLDAVAKSKVPCMSIMNMPPLPYVKRIPNLNTDPLKAAYADPTVWDSFDPALLTLCSPDPQAIRPPDEKVNVLQVTLPTNFKVARFDSDKHTAILRQLQDDIEAIRFDTGDGKIELPVKLKVHDSIFVPLAKWAMLLTGNYRCVTKDSAITIKEAVHSDLEASRSVYNFVRDLCIKLGAAPPPPTGSRARLQPPARSTMARPTSNARTSWCRPSRRRRGCATPSLMQPSHWSTRGSRPTGRRPPPDADPPAPIRAFGRSARASDVRSLPTALRKVGKAVLPHNRSLNRQPCPVGRSLRRPARVAAARIKCRGARRPPNGWIGESDFSSAGRG